MLDEMLVEESGFGCLLKMMRGGWFFKSYKVRGCRRRHKKEPDHGYIRARNTVHTYAQVIHHGESGVWYCKSFTLRAVPVPRAGHYSLPV